MGAERDEFVRPGTIPVGAHGIWRPVVALVRNETDREAVRDALGDLVAIEFCAYAVDLVRLVTRTSAHLVVAEPFDADGTRTGPALSGLRIRNPELHTVVYMSLTPADVHAAVEGWATDVVVRNHDNAARILRRALADAPTTASPGTLLAATATFAPRPVRAFFEYCAWKAHKVKSARVAAVEARMSYRTVSRWMRAAGLPTPGTVLAWYRLLHAAWQLEIRLLKLAAVAELVGFPSGRALAGSLKRHTGLSWPELRDKVGFAGLLLRFDDLLRVPGPDPPDMEEWRAEREDREHEGG